MAMRWRVVVWAALVISVSQVSCTGAGGRQKQLRLEMSRLSFPKGNGAGGLSYKDMEIAMQQSSERLHYLHQQLQQRLAGASSTYETHVSLTSNHAVFLTTLTIGTPPISFTAIVDTGSDLLWLQCQPCIHCFSSSIVFNSSSSSSFRALPCSSPLCTQTCDSPSSPCPYSIIYGDHSFTQGFLSQDVLTLFDLSDLPHNLSPFTFGCGLNNVGNSFGSSDGLMGLGQGDLSLISQLSISQFSYCLQSFTSPTSKTSPLFLGPSPLPNGPTLTTPILENKSMPSHYYVKLNGISVGGEPVSSIQPSTFDIQSNGKGGVIFDSGTTITLLPNATLHALKDALKNAITTTSPSNESPLCYESTAITIDTLPSLTFHFEGANVDLPAFNYFISLSDTGLTCLFIGSSEGLGISIFGAYQQQNFYVLHDLQSRTISLMPTTCESM